MENRIDYAICGWSHQWPAVFTSRVGDDRSPDFDEQGVADEQGSASATQQTTGVTKEKAMKGLGRRPEFDERSKLHPIRTLVAALPLRSYTWSVPVVLDQGSEGSCVGHAFSHEAAARPVKVGNITHEIAVDVYKHAQALDEWPGDNYSGTSILAGAKACVQRGWYTGYKWGFSLSDVLLALGYKGPVVLGINWYESMIDVGMNGIMRVEGDVAGGHAILANGVSIKNRTVRLHNSWGPDDWGNNGQAFISFKDLERLLSEEGEACVPLGRKLPLLTRISGAILNRLPGA